jgi:acyl carrier protein
MTVTEQQILAKVRELIVAIKRDTNPVAAEEVQPGSPVAAPPLSMDSLDYARFLVEIEEAFGISTDESEFLLLETVGDGVMMIAKRLADGAPPDGTA